MLTLYIIHSYTSNNRYYNFYFNPTCDVIAHIHEIITFNLELKVLKFQSLDCFGSKCSNMNDYFEQRDFVLLEMIPFE